MTTFNKQTLQWSNWKWDNRAMNEAGWMRQKIFKKANHNSPPPFFFVFLLKILLWRERQNEKSKKQREREWKREKWQSSGQCTGGGGRLFQLGHQRVNPEITRSPFAWKKYDFEKSTHRGFTISMSHHLLHTDLVRIRTLTDNRMRRATEVTDNKTCCR